MSVWGKVTSTLGNFGAGNQPNPNDPVTELKKKDKLIKEMQNEIARLKEDNEFINKAYEELE